MGGEWWGHPCGDRVKGECMGYGIIRGWIDPISCVCVLSVSRPGFHFRYRKLISIHTLAFETTVHFNS